MNNIKLAKELIGIAKSLVSKEVGKSPIYLEYVRINNGKVLFFASFDCEKEFAFSPDTRKASQDCFNKIRNDARVIMNKCKGALCDCNTASFSVDFLGRGHNNPRMFCKGTAQMFDDVGHIGNVEHIGDAKPICDVLKKLGYKERQL